jgi:hypothetical protein
MRRWRQTFSILACSAILGTGGCPNVGDVLDELENIEINIDQSVNTVQTVVPNDNDLPDVLVDDGDTIVIADDATIVTDVSETIVIEDLPDITLVGFENVTGLDAYYRYFVDGEFQGIFVFDNETLLIEYPCLGEIEVVSEEYFDPFTGELVEAFDLSGAIFFNPDDFTCGDAFIITFTEDDILVDTTAIDLLD